MAMEPDRQHQISDIYHAALEHPPGERAAFLNEACDGDEGLRQEIESLLGYEAATARFLETPAVHMIGRELGRTGSLAPLGAGGMGEVYRARDSKLDRDVAIKILPSHFTADPERRARFAREARLLATLNHPHIGAIYGLEEADGVAALVLELVEGPTLAERLERGPLPIVRRARDCAPDRRGARRRAREGDRPSRSEARQHRPARGRRIGRAVGRVAREGARLRPGEDDRGRPAA